MGMGLLGRGGKHGTGAKRRTGGHSIGHKHKSTSFGKHKGIGHSIGFGKHKGIGHSIGFGKHKGIGHSIGFGKRKGIGHSTSFGKRKKKSRRSGGGSSGGGALTLFTCCFGGGPEPYVRNQHDIFQMQHQQQHILAMHVQHQQQMQQFQQQPQVQHFQQQPQMQHFQQQPQTQHFQQQSQMQHFQQHPQTQHFQQQPQMQHYQQQPQMQHFQQQPQVQQQQQQVHYMPAPGLGWPSAGFGPNYINEEAAELQRSQHELLDDILAQQAKEKDPRKLEELFRQQNEVIQQMQQFQSAGFQYTHGIPTAQRPGNPPVATAGPSSQPMDVVYTKAQPRNKHVLFSSHM